MGDTLPGRQLQGGGGRQNLKPITSTTHTPSTSFGLLTSTLSFGFISPHIHPSFLLMQLNPPFTIHQSQVMSTFLIFTLSILPLPPLLLHLLLLLLLLLL